MFLCFSAHVLQSGEARQSKAKQGKARQGKAEGEKEREKERCFLPPGIQPAFMWTVKISACAMTTPQILCAEPQPKICLKPLPDFSSNIFSVYEREQ